MCLGGHAYRYQKDLAGGSTRWKCGNQSRQFRCLGYAVTRGVGAGCEIVNLGPHAPTCEPGESKGDAKAIRHAVIDTAAGAAGVTPTRAVAENLAGAGENVLQYLPDTHRLKRSAQNAAYRSRKRAGRQRRWCGAKLSIPGRASHSEQAPSEERWRLPAVR